MQTTRLFFFFECLGLTAGFISYAVRPFERYESLHFECIDCAMFFSHRDAPPLYGSIYAYDSESTSFRFYANFSYHINDNDTELYFFENGPVAVTNNSLSTIYFPIQCGTSFQRLLLISFNMKSKTYQQSPWILDDGVFHFLHYDPLRHRLFGLRDVDTFTLITEEYNLTTLEVVKEYTRQDGEKYAFIYAGCSIFDYEENWLVQVRTRFENPSVQAYYVKMDLNLVGKKQDIVTEFRLLPDIHNLCTMTYDIKTKTVLVTWQHGSIDQDLVMMYMNPYTGEFRNETLLLETGSGYVIESTEAVYNEKTHQILFAIDKENEARDDGENWMVIVDFSTMKIIEKKKVESITAFEYWEFFL
jgi:hypothetical protein